MSVGFLLPEIRCKRCGHAWHPRKQRQPSVCPRCKDPHYLDAYIQGPRLKLRRAAWRKKKRAA